MFINKKRVNKLIKETMKTGTLRIRTTEGSYIFGGLRWMIRIDKEMLPNETKGALITCCGELPDIGEQILVLKEGNQQEIPSIEIYDPESAACYVRTDLTIPGRRLYQEPMTGKIAAAPLGIADSIGNEYCDKAESGVTDPEVSRSTFTWSNSAMELQTGRMLTEDYMTVIKHMEGVRIVREEMQETETQEEHTAAE